MAIIVLIGRDWIVKEINMKRLFAIITLLSLLVVPVAADEFNYSGQYDAFKGGYVTSTETHWTSYGYKWNDTIQAMVKVLSYNTEVATGQNSVRVNSVHRASPYAEHSHNYQVL